MIEPTPDNPSLEERALTNYNIYWEGISSSSQYLNKWGRLQQAIWDKDTLTINEMVREACVEMFKQGFLLRLTGE